ncbi:MAG TPA: hypothetical protein DCG04_21855 [Rhodospirillaceae bacterium]|nr:hypothetical protein [Rhodospirillaceae bacterium]MAX64679.1 hypothetical protein [Rhodospirillaceae bacterium]MBB58651.1 hypothetical protein [Rhodospirillaceae bacterium]HAE04038.1 hypothetical protein [Rhodospirillaceae bacterium]HBM11742.1 hypothetical protein [Rhodospirillaceae bacterium]
MLHCTKNSKLNVLTIRVIKENEQNLSTIKILYPCDFSPQPAHSQQTILHRIARNQAKSARIPDKAIFRARNCLIFVRCNTIRTLDFECVICQLLHCNMIRLIML